MTGITKKTFDVADPVFWQDCIGINPPDNIAFGAIEPLVSGMYYTLLFLVDYFYEGKLAGNFG